MRTVSGTRNRTILLVLGLVLLVVGVALALLATGTATRISGAATWIPESSTTLGSVLGPANQYMLPIGIAVTVVVGLLALWWLLCQIPSKDHTGDYRLADDLEHGIVSVGPGVLARAVQDQLEDLPWITRAHAELAGTAGHPELLIRLALAPRTSVNRLLEQVYGTVVRDLETALETRLEHVCLELHVTREASGNAKTSTRQISTSSASTEPAGIN